MPDLTHIQTQCLTSSAATICQDWVVSQRHAINQQDRQNWSQIKSLSDWQTYCAPRIDALKKSLGNFPDPPQQLSTHTTNTLKGDGYTIENIVYESRDNIFVSANRYLPNPLREHMPGIILVHSHHNPKIQGELQDMGILWARSGCIVLVMDQFAYGDRRDHAFAPRQDYWFRDITGKQLHTLGDSLMGWMVWDIHRGVDLLLEHPNIASDKIIVMGSVAGGGDPCAVAGALDERIACTIPFNFGGPQPESPFPLPEDAEKTFNYLGSGSWETTRNLRLSGRDGFLAWLIVGSIAPRRLIYAHEFEWDQERDPVWKRLQQIYDWHNASENLDYTQGFGQLQGRPPQASHCNNVGEPHRQRIYAALQKWFDIAPPSEEVQERYPDKELQSLTTELREKLNVPKIHTVLKTLGTQRITNTPKTQKDLQTAWSQILGEITPESANVASHNTETAQDITLSRTVLTTESNTPIPLLTLTPPDSKHIVVAISQAGKESLLSERRQAYQALLEQGIAICLPDLRGTGETAPEGSRSFRSAASSLSANTLMFGQTSLGNRLKDLRTVLEHLRNTAPKSTLSIWGDSIAPTNPVDFEDPLLNSDTAPHQAEPSGGLLALFATLFESDIHALAISGMLVSYHSILDHVYCYLPHDVIIPGALQAGDLCDIASAIAPTSLLITNLVDARNCLVSEAITQQTYKTTIEAYQKTPNSLTIQSKQNISDWFIQNLL